MTRMLPQRDGTSAALQQAFDPLPARPYAHAQPMRTTTVSALLALLATPGPALPAIAGEGTLSADIRVTLDDNQLRARPGDTLTYELTVFNAGPDAAPIVNVQQF